MTTDSTPASLSEERLREIVEKLASYPAILPDSDELDAVLSHISAQAQEVERLTEHLQDARACIQMLTEAGHRDRCRAEAAEGRVRALVEAAGRVVRETEQDAAGRFIVPEDAICGLMDCLPDDDAALTTPAAPAQAQGEASINVAASLVPAGWSWELHVDGSPSGPRAVASVWTNVENFSGDAEHPDPATALRMAANQVGETIRATGLPATDGGEHGR